MPAREPAAGDAGETMRIRSPHHHLRKGLTHPNRLVAAFAWVFFLVLLWMLVRVAAVLLDDFWVLVIAMSQP